MRVLGLEVRPSSVRDELRVRGAAPDHGHDVVRAPLHQQVQFREVDDVLFEEDYPDK